MGNKQECSKDDPQVPTIDLSTKPLSAQNSASIASEACIKNANHNHILVPHKKSSTDSTTPCSPLSTLSIPHCCEHRTHRQSLPNMTRSHSHIDIKTSQSHSHLLPHPINLRKPTLTITPSPSASPYPSLHLAVPTVTRYRNRSLWSEASMTNHYSEDSDSQSDTESASTPWVLYMDVKQQQLRPTLTIQQLHCDEVMLSAPPSPSESIRSYEYIACDAPISPRKSSVPDTPTLCVEPVDVQ